MGQAGVKKIAEFEWKGKKYPIQVDIDYGYFTITVPTKDPTDPKRFSGKDLQKVREDVKAYLLEQTELKWECMIHVFNDASRGELDLKVNRYWKAVHGDGTVVWRNDDGPYHQAPSLGKHTLEDRDKPHDRGTLIPYLQQHWETLRRLEENVYHAHEVIDQGLHQGNIQALLEIYGNGGFAQLLANPKNWKISKRY